MKGFHRTPPPRAFDDDRPTDEIDPAWDDAAAEALLEESQDEAKSHEPMEDSVQLYLREIGQVSLLTAADEVMLAQEILRGHEARQRLQRLGDWCWSAVSRWATRPAGG